MGNPAFTPSPELRAFLRRLTATLGLTRYAPVGSQERMQAARHWLLDAALAVDASLSPDAGVAITTIWFVDGPVIEQELDRVQGAAGSRLCIHDCSPLDQRKPRAEWERALIERGWRKHAALFELQDYGSLDFPGRADVHLFERLPSELVDAYPLERLAAERDLHMDMTREPGRRSDAHMVRYSLAAKFMREGDRVLDAACGLGYGTSALATLAGVESVQGIDVSDSAVKYARLAFSNGNGAKLAFSAADAENLADLPSDSFDYIVSVETLEHLHRPDQFLWHLHRLLREGGRLFVSVPLDWADETGEDPNPYHFHVYDWEKLSSQLSAAGFAVERGWLQDAGGGMKRTDCPRALREFDPVAGPQGDGEWLLALAMKPLDWSGVADSVPSRPSGDSDGVANILAFDRDYLKPELVRALIAIGWRATTPTLRERLARDVLAHAPGWSADYGAALCVLGYVLMERSQAGESLRQLIDEADRYRAIEPRNATCYRWQVSLSFLAARLALALGDRKQALRRFTDCAAMDPLPFSPLLATKTVGAGLRSGLLALSMGQPDEAVMIWQAAVDSVRGMFASMNWKEVLGSDTAPLASFGFPELAEVLQLAGQCAAGIRAVRSPYRADGTILARIGQSVPDSMASHADELQSMRLVVGELTEQLADCGRHLQARAEEMMVAIASREQAIADLKSHIDGRARAIEWLQQQVANHQNELAAARDAYSSLRTELDNRNSAVGWLEQQLLNHREELSHRGETITQLTDHVEQLGHARTWLESQLANHQQEHARLLEAANVQEALLRDRTSQAHAVRSELDALRMRLASLEGSPPVRLLRRLRLLRSVDG